MQTSSGSAASSEVEGDAPPWQRIRREIDLPAPTAVWVLLAHVLTIASPLLLVFAVAAWGVELEAFLDEPAWLYASAACFALGSVCESAQNTLDRWYLVGVPPSLLDLCFNSLIVAGLACQVLAVAADDTWAQVLAVALVVSFPVAYLMAWPTPAWQAVGGLAAAGLLIQALGQPVVALSLVTVFLTLFFLDILLKTQQQVMHGFVTLVNAFSVVALVLALGWATSDVQGSWVPVLGVSAVVVLGVVAVRPWLLRLPPTPRPFSSS